VVELIADLYLVSRLRLSGAVCLLPLYAFMALTGTAFSVFFIMMEEPVSEAQILHVLTLSDIISKFRIFVVLIIVD